MNYNTLVMQNDGFNSLMEKSEVLPNKYAPLVKGLKQLYINFKSTLDEINNELLDVVNTAIDHQRENYDWYADYNFFGATLLTDEILDYYLNDNNYRNSLADYSNIAIDNLMRYIIQIRVDAISYIREIDVLLEQNTQYSFDVNGSDYAHWNGTYHFEGDTVQIENDANGMKWFNKGEWEEIYPLSKTKFHFESSVFLQFVNDEDGEINGINIHKTNTNNTYQKIAENN